MEQLLEKSLVIVAVLQMLKSLLIAAFEISLPESLNTCSHVHYLLDPYSLVQMLL